MANALQDVVNTFLTLDKQYNELRLACRTQTDRDELDRQYTTAQANNEECTNKELQDDDRQVAALSNNLKARNAELQRAVVEMGNMTKVLDNLTAAVTIGSELVALVA